MKNIELLAGTDIETTGLEQEKGHRIIEIFVGLYQAKTGELVDKYEQRINPQRSIDPMAQRVHGISIEELSGMPTWNDVAMDIYNFINRADMMVCHNMNFDGPFIANELMRIDKPVPDVEAFCTMESGRWATFNGKNPSLKELCFAVNVPYDASKAHAAFYDVDQMMKCLFRGIALGFYDLSAEL